MNITGIKLTRVSGAALWFKDQADAVPLAQSVREFYQTEVLLAKGKDGRFAVCTSHGCVMDPDVTGHDIEITHGHGAVEIIESHKKDHDGVITVVGFGGMLVALLL